MKLCILKNAIIMAGVMVSATPADARPHDFVSASPIGISEPSLNLGHNSRKQIRQELRDTNTMRIIVNSCQLSENERASFVVSDGIGDEVWLFLLDASSAKACGRFGTRISEYVSARLEGHTMECLISALTNQTVHAPTKDPDMILLLKNRPLLPLSWIQRDKSGMTTNIADVLVTSPPPDLSGLVASNIEVLKTNQICRWVSFNHVDGEVAWCYRLTFLPDGSLCKVHERRTDAKDIDQHFQKAIENVDAQLKIEMEKSGKSGQLGEIREYWREKKKRLAAQGVKWRSPEELNPGTHFD